MISLNIKNHWQVMWKPFFISLQLYSVGKPCVLLCGRHLTHTPDPNTTLWTKYDPSWHSLMAVTPSAGQCTLTHYKMCSGTAWGTQQIAKVWGKSDPWRPNPKHTAPKGNNYKRPGAGHQRTPPVVFCQCFDRPEQRNLHNIKLLVQWCDWSVCLGLHCSCTVL